MGDDLGEVDLHALHLNADLLALISDVLHQLGGVQQALGGNAAHVQAGAAQVLLLNNCHLGPQLGRPDGRHVPAGAAADDDDASVPGGLCRRRRRGSCRGSGGGGRQRGSASHGLSRLANPGQGALHRHVLPLLGHNFQQGALGLAGHLVGQLVGGDLQNHIANFDGVALMLDPLGDRTLLHGQPQLGHFHFKSHW